MKRIFLELDDIIDGLPDCVPQPCAIISYCSDDIKKTWEAIVSADEIYFSSTFLSNGKSVISSSEIFNLLMDKAIKDGLSGKSVYCCTLDAEINWQRIDEEFFNKLFYKDNMFFTRNENSWGQMIHLL